MTTKRAYIIKQEETLKKHQGGSKLQKSRKMTKVEMKTAEAEQGTKKQLRYFRSLPR